MFDAHSVIPFTLQQSASVWSTDECMTLLGTCSSSLLTCYLLLD